MIKRVVRKLKLLNLERGVRSFEDFQKSSHGRVDPAQVAESAKMLQPLYDQYVRDVSRADMAASLEAVAYLYSLCKANHYIKLLDVGSGFSSFVLRLYARETPGVEVYSVDDDAAWLQKTKAFLEGHQVNTDKLYTLNDFLKLGLSGFDCILHDMNFVEVRILYVDNIVEVCRPGGLIILDDVHKPDYRFEALSKLANTHSTVYSLEPVTRDRFERYSYGVIKA